MGVQRVAEFDLWRPEYQGATVTVYIAGTTTLASLFTDEALTFAAPNPQTLLTGTINGVSVGKLVAPVYTSSPYTLSISTGEVTGIQRTPITTLIGEDISKAVVTVPGSAQANELEDIRARTVYVEDYGPPMAGAAAATNNTTLTAAIGALPAGGGRVLLPSGTIAYTGVTLGEGIVLEGFGQGATTLTCTTGGACITLAGARAGLGRLTHNGISKVVGSVGLASVGQDQIVFDEVRFSNFETGIHIKGAFNINWRSLFVNSCDTGVKLHGDVDAGGSGAGNHLGHLLWHIGNVTNCTVIGVDMSYEDRQIYNSTFQFVAFSSNTGIAVNINGARRTKFEGCAMSSNTTNVAVDDDSLTTVDNNKIDGLLFSKCRILGGAITFAGTCKDVIFDNTELEGVAFELTAPGNNILLLGSAEDGNVTVSGTGADRLIRRRDTNRGSSAGTTSDATATKAWSMTLDPGQIVYLEAKVIGKQNNSEDRAIYHVACGALRPGSTLDYDAQTADFTLSRTLTGATSGATANILADADAGANGTLTLDNISGAFQNNEIITDSAGGSASANGALVTQNVILDTVGNESLRTAYETVVGWAAIFAVSGGIDIEFHVTGAVGDEVNWTVDVDVVST